MRIAVEGCCHGELDKIYETIQHLESREQTKIDMLICCGDFQAVRNYDDLACMACPDKYKRLNTFWKYYSGAAQAPYLTIFIGGNHEASNFLAELPFGGWVAPNIYFLGNAGVVNFGGLRIGGLTGIYNQRHYRTGHFEVPPYTQSTMRSAYHIRELDVYRLMQLQQPLDVFLSHDWPSRIADHGNKAQLCRCKKFLAKEIMDGSLGSPPAAQLLKELQPTYWFSAHMHVKFPAVVAHSVPRHPRSSDQPACTHFLALDKCLPGRGFLQDRIQMPTLRPRKTVDEASLQQEGERGIDCTAPDQAKQPEEVVDFPETGQPKELCYDEEWLAVLRSTHHLMKTQQYQPALPGLAQTNGPPKRDVDAVEEALQGRSSRSIPQNFSPTAPVHNAQGKQGPGRMPSSLPRNPQTLALLGMLGLPYNLDPPAGSRTDGRAYPNSQQSAPEENPEEIDLDTGSGGEEAATAAATANPEEIDLDGLDDQQDEEAGAGAANENPEEIDLGDLDGNELDESPPDKITG